MANRCGIKHGFSDAVCIRAKWWSRDGKFHSHVGYRTIYPTNAAR